MGAIGHGVSPAMPAMPVLRVYRACESPSIILESRSAKTRAHELFSGALAAKAASFDCSSDSSFRELLELVVLQPVESQRPSPRLTPPAPRWRPPWAACPRTPSSLEPRENIKSQDRLARPNEARTHTSNKARTHTLVYIWNTVYLTVYSIDGT